MPHLARLGHEVVGVEGVPVAASLFAKDHPQLGMAKAPAAPASGSDCPTPPAAYVPAAQFEGRREGYVFTTREGRLGYHRDAPPGGQAAAGTDKGAAQYERSTWLSAGMSAQPRSDRRAHAGGGVWLSVGDWFKASARELGTFGRAWDRGSLVAIPPVMRAQYAEVMDRLLEPSGRILLSGYEYDQAKAPGPPFALSVEEVAALYPGYRVTLLERVDVSAEFRKRTGTPWERIGQMDEVAILLVKRRAWWRRLLWPFGADYS
jgi:hypothetical protein